ncbi:MAG: ComF family protein [Bacillota bacterium]
MIKNFFYNVIEKFNNACQSVKNFFWNIKEFFISTKDGLSESVKEGRDFLCDDHDRKLGLTEVFGSYRHTCPECGVEIFTEDIFCEECSKQITLLSGDKCPRCGRKVSGNHSCNICRNNHHYFDRGFSAFDYDGLIVKYILNMKFYGKAYLYHMFAKYLAHVYMRSNISADFVTFVPMTKKSIKERGYNQSELLAREFSHLTGIPLFTGVIKKHETEFQKRLNAEGRRKNMRDVFKVEGDTRGKSFLIIDDVMTTCATIDSLSKAFKRKNSSKIYAITIASTSEKIAKN